MFLDLDFDLSTLCVDGDFFCELSDVVSDLLTRWVETELSGFFSLAVWSEEGALPNLGSIRPLSSLLSISVCIF